MEFEQLSIRWKKDTLLEILDQTQLPLKENWIVVESSQHMWKLIKDLVVRGAPLIGVAAAYSLVVDAVKGIFFSRHLGLPGADRGSLIKNAEYVRTSRPTAVNLMYCCDLIVARLSKCKDEEAHKIITDTANELCNKEVEMNEKMAKYGAALVIQTNIPIPLG